MPIFSVNSSAPPPSNTIIYRPVGGIEGYREIHDKSAAIFVTCFPWAMVREVPKAAVPACYILADHTSAYIGETNDEDRRLGEHARAPSKSFAREAFVVAGVGDKGKLRFNATAAKYLQFWLTTFAEEAGLVDVIKGVAPQLPDVDEFDRATFDAFVEDSQRLLFDAGCRALQSNFVSQRRATVDVEPLASVPAGPMRIGVVAAPPPGGELELCYGDLWVRGFHNEGRFVVTAGSEVRKSVNESAWDWIKKDRSQLRDENALVSISDLEDRERLAVAVEFDSPSSAAKVVTGSRDGSKWLPVRIAQRTPTTA